MSAPAAPLATLSPSPPRRPRRAAAAPNSRYLAAALFSLLAVALLGGAYLFHDGEPVPTTGPPVATGPTAATAPGPTAQSASEPAYETASAALQALDARKQTADDSGFQARLAAGVPPDAAGLAGIEGKLELPGPMGDRRISPLMPAADAATADGGAAFGATFAALPQDPGALRNVMAAEGRYALQFFALRSFSAAQRAWIELLADNVGLLANLEPRVEKTLSAESQERLFRLQAGTMASLAEAQLLCRKLRARNVDCLVVVLRDDGTSGHE